MKRIFVALVLAFALGAPSAIAQSPAPVQAEHGVPVQRIVSPGGIEAWLVSNSTVPIIVMNAYWRGGAATEPRNMIGVTSIMADQMTEGAGDLASDAFKERLESLNMGLGFAGGWDGVSMSVTTLSENRDAAFDLARMALMQPRFDEAPLALAKARVMVGIRQRETNPNYIGYLALDQALYPDHPYASRTSTQDVAAMTPIALRQRHDAIFNRARLQITIVGDIDVETAGRVIDHVFGGLPQGGLAPEPADVSLRPPTPLIARDLPQPQSLIIFAAPGIQDEDPDWIPLVVANYILGGGGFSSRLMDQVREQRGLVYGIGTSSSVRDHSALILGSAQTENARVSEAIALTHAEIGRLYRDGATQTEVNDAITYLTGSSALDLDSDVKIANVLQGNQIAGRGVDYVNRSNDLIRVVTLADVNRVIRRLFNPESFTFVVVGQPTGLDGQASR